MNKPKKIGTAAETAVARFLQANGLEFCLMIVEELGVRRRVGSR